jgi:hypothetical protein
MDDDLDDQGRIIEQDEEDFEQQDDEEALGQGMTFRRPNAPLTLVQGQRDRSTMLDFGNKKKELLHMKSMLDITIGESARKYSFRHSLNNLVYIYRTNEEPIQCSGLDVHQ